jgi:hypothetical protein
MSPETLARMLGAANRCYRGRFGFSDLADLKETAKVWSAVLEEMEDAEGVAAFLEHCRHSVHPPTPADINDLVELTRVLEPQRCARCEKVLSADDLLEGEALEDGSRHCPACYIETHGGLPAGERAPLLLPSLKGLERAGGAAEELLRSEKRRPR